MFVTHLLHPLIAYRGDIISESDVTLVSPFESWKQEGKFNEKSPIHVVAFLKPSLRSPNPIW